MPEFEPLFVPPKVDDFARGCFTAVEFTLDDEDQERLRGWRLRSRHKVIRDCKHFRAAHWRTLKEYMENTGESMETCGTLFWFSRIRSGAGFRDHPKGGGAGDILHRYCRDVIPCTAAVDGAGKLFVYEGS